LKKNKVQWASYNFHPIVNLPDDYQILDLTKGRWSASKKQFSIGKYNEFRPNMYNTKIFEGKRNIHMGIDIGGPVGTSCMAFSDGTISHFGYNPEPGDYGNVLITRHKFSGIYVWALYGHLSSESINHKEVGQTVAKGEVLGWFGNYQENGGWAPHVHFQLSLLEPTTHDLPGVVSEEDRSKALEHYPDPRLVLGSIY